MKKKRIIPYLEESKAAKLRLRLQKRGVHVAYKQGNLIKPNDYTCYYVSTARLVYDGDSGEHVSEEQLTKMLLSGEIESYPEIQHIENFKSRLRAVND